jgi:hypothetical protein
VAAVGTRVRQGLVRVSVGLVAAALGLGLTVGCDVTVASPTGDPTVGAPQQLAPVPGDPGANAAKPTAASVAQARKALPTVAIKVIPGKDSTYERDLFGAPWSDAAVGVRYAHNGCDTRNDILRRDAVRGTIKAKANTDGCKVASGKWTSPYTGNPLATTRSIQIDHIIPLGRAWASGAKSWTAAQRLSYANDPDNLIAVDGRSNESKGDKGPAAWKPAARFQCTYGVRYIRVAVKYRLPITVGDRSALQAMLAGCPKR